jgi:hypothetical protein
MQMQMFLVIALIGTQLIVTDASYERIAGYAPGSKVTSHNAIDLDQKAIENILSGPMTDAQYLLVKDIYEQGGNSKSYAEYTVPALTTALSKSDVVTGLSSGLLGSIYTGYPVDATTIRVTYPTSIVQASYVGCKVGALQAAPTGTTATASMEYIFENACLQNEDLRVTHSGVDVTITPTGPPTNKAGRTLQGFSGKAGGTMYTTGPNGGCSSASDRATDGCPYLDFTQYYNYYGNLDYADKFVLAAINGGPTNFGSVEGNMDFTGTSDAMRKQCIKKGTAYMNAHMYAIREFEDAIDDCKAGCPGGQGDVVSGQDCNSLSAASVHAWDEGVAFYAGSLEGTLTGGNSAGKLSYRLAEKRCSNFKTCGPNGDSTSGTSYVNTKLFEQFAIGQHYLLSGQCDAARPVVRQVVALMSIPLIQGTLRYAYKVDKLNGGDTEKGEGAVFAAAIVPRVAYCSSTDATTIMTNMKIGASSTSFAAVMTAFKNNYACMNVTCAEVGGLWFESQGTYYDGADPDCGTTTTTTTGTSESPPDGTASGASPRADVLSVAKAILGITMIFCCHGQ